MLDRQVGSSTATASTSRVYDPGVKRRLFAGFRPLSGFGLLRMRSQQNRSISLPESNFQIDFSFSFDSLSCSLFSSGLVSVLIWKSLSNSYRVLDDFLSSRFIFFNLFTLFFILFRVFFDIISTENKMIGSIWCLHVLTFCTDCSESHLDVPELFCFVSLITLEWLQIWLEWSLLENRKQLRLLTLHVYSYFPIPFRLISFLKKFLRQSLLSKPISFHIRSLFASAEPKPIK